MRIGEEDLNRSIFSACFQALESADGGDFLNR